LLLFLILQVSDEQSEINIEILGGEKKSWLRARYRKN